MAYPKRLRNGVDFVQSVLKYWRNELLTAASRGDEPQVSVLVLVVFEVTRDHLFDLLQIGRGFLLEQTEEFLVLRADGGTDLVEIDGEGVNTELTGAPVQAGCGSSGAARAARARG